MGTRVASIVAEIGMDAGKFTSGAGNVNGILQSTIGKFGVLPGVVGIAGAAFFALTGYLRQAEEAAVDSAKADANIASVLESTGHAAGQTAGSIDALTSALSHSAEIDDELLKNAEAVLLTFTTISEDVFPKASQAAVDLAARFGGDLNSAFLTVGKSLSNFSGYTKLARQGVEFNDVQIEQIKNFRETNDLAGYQNLVLSVLAVQTDNAAAKMAAAGDHSELAKIAFGNLSEEIGTGMIPGMASLNSFLAESADGWTTYLKGMRQAGEVAERTKNILHAQGLQATFNEDITKNLTLATQEQIQAAKDRAVAEIIATDAIAGTTTAIGEQIDADAAMAQAFDTVKNAISFANILDSFEESEQRLTTTQGELTAELAEATRVYGENSKQAQAVRDKIADTAAAQGDLARQTNAAVKAAIFQQVSSKASAATQLELAKALGIISEEDYNIAKATDQIINQGTPDYVDPEEVVQLKELSDKVMSLKGQKIPITFQAIMSGLDLNALANDFSSMVLSNLDDGYVGGGGSPGGTPANPVATPYAEGGFVEGVGNSDSVPAMLTPGEYVLTKDDVSELLSGGGGQTVVNVFLDGEMIYKNVTRRMARAG